MRTVAHQYGLTTVRIEQICRNVARFNGIDAYRFGAIVEIDELTRRNPFYLEERALERTQKTA